MKKLTLSITILLSMFCANIKSSGMSYKVGNYYYYTDFDSGTQYTSYSVGDYDYVNGSNGYSGCGYRVGNYYYYND